MTEEKKQWPHDCKTCAKLVKKEEAIDIGKDQNGMPIDWYECPICGNGFCKEKGN